jgi:hypothetical protein
MLTRHFSRRLTCSPPKINSLRWRSYQTIELLYHFSDNFQKSGSKILQLTKLLLRNVKNWTQTKQYTFRLGHYNNISSAVAVQFKNCKDKTIISKKATKQICALDFLRFRALLN